MTAHRWLETNQATWVVDIGNSGIKVTLAHLRTDAAANQTHTGGNFHAVLKSKSLNWKSDTVEKIWQATWRHADLQSTANKDSHVSLFSQSEALLDVDDPTWPGRLIDEVHRAFQIDSTTIQANWLVSSVQRRAWATWSEQLPQIRPTDQTIKFENLDLAWKLDVDFPERVGTDRVLAAWAAWNLTDRHAPLLIIQAGTAITVDAVDEHGRYAGGAILPGLRLTLNAMAGGTDLLPQLFTPHAPIELPPLPAKNTEAAMLAGGVAAVIGGIDHLLRRYQDRWSASLPSYLSGGTRAYLSPLLAHPVRVVDHLVLLGLCGFLDSSGE